MQFDKRAWLDKVRQMFAGFDRPLALIVFLLLCVGIVTLYSASSDMPGRVEDDYDSEFRYGSRPLASLQGLDDGGRVIYVGSHPR